MYLSRYTYLHDMSDWRPRGVIHPYINSSSITAAQNSPCPKSCLTGKASFLVIPSDLDLIGLSSLIVG